ncbi:MAG TPA: hypothetical protein VKT78_17350 [Fimbriimonadaceae bacterium]|nr:hypothetical protein [Fimbriimonadaceae bacterium]
MSRLLRLLLFGIALFGLAAGASAQTNTLNVSSTPITGIPITVAPNDINGNGNGVTNFSRVYSTAITIPTVTVTAPAAFNGEVFQVWTINGIPQQPGITTINVAMANTENVQAVYTTPTVTLNVASQGTSNAVLITDSPADNGGQTSGSTPFALNYPNLTQVTLTAPMTSGGQVFDHWVLGVTSQPPGQNVLVVNLAGSTRATAVYVAPVLVSVYSQNPASGILISAAPPDINNISSAKTLFTLSYPPNTSVTLTAPATSGLSVFQNWQLNGVDQPAGQLSVTFTASAPVTVTAVYLNAQYTVTASAGPHGSINPSGVVPIINGQLFTATPVAGWMVNQWVYDGKPVQTGGNTYSVGPIGGNHTLNVTFRVIIVLHPADTNKDGLITIGEVTAYGLAWLKGTPWPNPPSPIPQSFVTNAIMLWKAGEAYSNDPSKAAPDTWVPIAQAPQLAKPAAVAKVAKGTSRCSISRQADGWYLVNVTVTPPDGTKAFTAEEHLPKGAQVKAVSAGGVVDPRGMVIRWGPFMDASTRIFSYKIKTSGAAEISGAVSFNGTDVKTTGDRTVGGSK